MMYVMLNGKMMLEVLFKFGGVYERIMSYGSGLSIEDSFI